MKISAVIPVWNGREYLEKLLNAIEGQTLAFDEVIVVDNGSEDGAGELATRHGAKVVRFAKNRGFAAAVNRGVAECTGDCIAVLNSDVELASDWVALLSRAVTQSAIFFATGKALCYKNRDRIDGCWDLVSRAGMPWRVGNGTAADHPAFRESQIIPMASFTAILFRRELWERIGPLDERFESYLEDVDFGMRCVAAGISGIYEPNAVCFHHGSATLGKWNKASVRRMSRNQVFLARKHLSVGWWTLLVGQGLWGIVAFRHGAGIAWFRGKLEGWRRRREFARNPISLAKLESEILALQSRVGFDFYWRWYARLRGRNDTGPAHE